MKNDLTSGSVFGDPVRFSLPYLLAFLADALRHGGSVPHRAVSTTAVSVGSQVMHMLTVMLVGPVMRATVCIGQAVGAGDRRRAAQDTGNSAVLFAAVSVVLTAVLLLLVRPIVSVMSTPAAAVEGTVAYLTVCFLGVLFITAYDGISSVFRGMGDSKSPMIFVAVACAANIAPDHLFMGALLSVLICLIAFAVLRRKKSG